MAGVVGEVVPVEYIEHVESQVHRYRPGQLDVLGQLQVQLPVAEEVVGSDGNGSTAAASGEVLARRQVTGTVVGKGNGGGKGELCSHDRVPGAVHRRCADKTMSGHMIVTQKWVFLNRRLAESVMLG